MYSLIIWSAIGIGICLVPAIAAGALGGFRAFFIVFGLFLILSPAFPWAYCAATPSPICTVLPWLSFFPGALFVLSGLIVLIVASNVSAGKTEPAAKPSSAQQSINNGA
jgi:hypothetical protein